MRQTLLAAFLFLFLAAGPTVERAAADANEPGLEAYDTLPPDEKWRDSIRLRSVPAAYDGAGVTVAVLDTGVTRHPDLGDRVRRARRPHAGAATATTATATART